MSETTMRNYPLPRPTDPAEDPRFTVGLVLEVAEVLSRHGYPRPDASADDFTDLQQALFRFLYAPAR